MIALQILEVKPFMNKLLTSDMFHHFLLAEATIVNGVSYTVDGHITREDANDLREEFPYALASFDRVQKQILEMIKGSHTPTYMKFVFCLSPDNVINTLNSIQSSLDPSSISGMYINLVYQGEHILCTTGVSYSIFAKDHALEQEWDRLVKLFFTKQNVYYETLS